jgi:hypothetical protein
LHDHEEAQISEMDVDEQYDELEVQDNMYRHDYVEYYDSERDDFLC